MNPTPPHWKEARRLQAWRLKQKGWPQRQIAEALGQTLLFIDESGFSPLPSVVRTYAPIGRTPSLKAWGTRDHLSAISAISPAGQVDVHSQGCALKSAA